MKLETTCTKKHTLVLESQDEIDMLYLLGRLSPLGASGLKTLELYNKLGPAASEAAHGEQQFDALVSALRRHFATWEHRAELTPLQAETDELKQEISNLRSRIRALLDC